MRMRATLQSQQVLWKSILCIPYCTFMQKGVKDGSYIFIRRWSHHFQLAFQLKETSCIIFGSFYTRKLNSVPILHQQWFCSSIYAIWITMGEFSSLTSVKWVGCFTCYINTQTVETKTRTVNSIIHPYERIWRLLCGFGHVNNRKVGYHVCVLFMSFS